MYIEYSDFNITSSLLLRFITWEGGKASNLVQLKILIITVDLIPHISKNDIKELPSSRKEHYITKDSRADNGKASRKG